MAPSATTPRLVCLDCAVALMATPEQMACPSCGKSWPLKEGIPRLYTPDYYWGEVSQQEAQSLLWEAREIGWRQAVERRFKDDRDMLISILDWQRVSWVPLVGLNPDAVALDVGSGYGAITHTLARTVREVYSLEAIPERLEFLRIRLEQEGIQNVHLVQCSALAPPLLDNSFDLIVVNGVLEWVGLWDRHPDPRAVQLHFLAKLRRLLRDGGVLVVGIENRYGHTAWRGAMDHSGLPYTSLMPRFLASLYMRAKAEQHHRMNHNWTRQYRTYTYSQRGYRKLLAESGLLSPQFYWADPGYNQPYSLIPLEKKLVQGHGLQRLRYAPSPRRKSWRRSAKAAVIRMGVPVWFVPEYLILAEKGTLRGWLPTNRLWAHLRMAMPQLPSVAKPVFALVSHPFSRKNVVAVYEADANVPSLVLKSSTSASDSMEVVEAELRNLELLNAQLRTQANPTFSVPEAIGSLKIGPFLFTVESVAAGRELSELLLPPRHPANPTQLAGALQRSIEAAIQIAQMLRGHTSIEPVDSRWWELPQELESEPDIQLLKEPRNGTLLLDGERYENWVQHGDFTIYNLFVEESSGKLTVVDWGSLRRGLPPLYDVLSLLISVLPVMQLENIATPADNDLLEAQFLEAFFGRGRWSKLNAQLLLGICRHLGIPSHLIWDMLVQFLFLRARFYLSRGSEEARSYLSFLRLTSRHTREFLPTLQEAESSG